jgi:hypothetical protein
MPTEKEIQQALHAGRVISLTVPNPHGPLGLEQLAAAVSAIAESPLPSTDRTRIRRPISLSVQAWEKLERLAQTTSQTTAHPVSASELATAILEQFVANTNTSPN